MSRFPERQDAVMKDQRHPNSIERGVDVLFMSQLQGHENVVENGTSLQANEVRKTGHVQQQAHAPLASTTAPAGTTATAATASSFSTPASTSKLQTVNVSTMPRSCSPTEEDRLTTWCVTSCPYCNRLYSNVLLEFSFFLAPSLRLWCLHLCTIRRR